MSPAREAEFPGVESPVPSDGDGILRYGFFNPNQGDFYEERVTPERRNKGG